MHYVKTQPVLQGLLVLALLPVGLGLPYMTMLTVFARDVLDVGGPVWVCSRPAPVSAPSWRAVRRRRGQHAARLADAWRDHRVRRGAVRLRALAVVWFSALMLLIVGTSQQVYMTTNNTVVQEMVDDEYRGACSSIVFLNRAMIPMGTMVAGFGTAIFGVQHTMAVMAAALVLTGLLAIRFSPAARALD